MASLGPTLGPLSLHWDALLAHLGCPWAHLGPLGAHWGALGAPWEAFGGLGAPFGVPFGTPWAALGCLGVLWGAFRGPVGRLGVPWGCLGVLSWILMKIGFTFRANGLKVHSLPSKNSLSELTRGIAGIRGNGPNRAGPDLCSTRAWGKNNGSYHKLPKMSRPGVYPTNKV